MAIWLRKDPIRWVAGGIAGLFAGLVMLGFAMLVAVMVGEELWFPAKYAALPVLGSEATRLGFELRPILTGVFVHEALCLVLGVAYAHFTGTNSLVALLGAGFVWGTFSWVFISNLFLQSFRSMNAVQIPSGVMLPLNLAFGLALASVAFFDRALRGGRA